MTTPLRRFAGALLVAAAFLVAALSAAEPVRDIMEQVTIPESTAIFSVTDPPASEAEWRLVRSHAEGLARSGERLLLSAPDDNVELWTERVREHVRAADEILAAADAKNFDALLEAGEHLVATCSNCHERFLKQR